jgi:Leucine-rich repeat (LRR) protein
LASLPEDLAALQWLETLDLTDNCFGTFPLPVLELGSLTHLFIGANSLPRLPDLSALEMLASIDVSGNSLKELNPSIWELPRLRELRAADNDIAELRVEEGASFLRLKLRVLRLENNRIMCLPAELAGLNNLVDVSLEGNLLAEALAGDDPTVNRMRATCEKHSGELLL